ncbi:calcium-binding protein [Paracoccus aminovorans]|uniref:calcium-binding protein n=1 Tax=Paracoccus aminovorans TaxID=34004 RepID=UPI0007853586|nr:calcium-binding protein [Paracoccus aminovorans]
MPTNNDDLIYSTSVNDRIQGLTGADTFYWTPSGQDTFIGGDQGERYDPNPYLDRTGGDQLHIQGNAGVNVRFATTEDGLAKVGGHSLKFEGIERFYGTSGNDTIRAAGSILKEAHSGTPVHGVTIYAGAGHDIITGTATDDVLDGGAGNDSIWGGAGNDFIQSSTGHDLIYGGLGDENIRWGLGDDVAPGNDTIYGGAGHDLINIWSVEPDHTGAYVEYITSSKGRAYTDMGDVHNVLHFQSMEQGWTHQGRDTVTGANASVGVNATGIQFNTRWDNDLLIGTNGRDTLEGGEDRDTIEGGRGNDLISANGDFTSWQAPGDGDVDTLVFHAGFGHDTVLAFDEGVDILQFDRGMSYSVSEVARGTLLTFDTGDTILLSNVFDFN